MGCAQVGIALVLGVASAVCVQCLRLTALVGAGFVSEIKINWVWNPPWGPDKITDDGREQLRALGFTV